MWFFPLDLDECTTGSHSCDVNSVCQNTVGSYTCSCNAGYTGDGKPCNGILDNNWGKPRPHESPRFVQKDAVSVSGFTSFVWRPMPIRVKIKNVALKNIWFVWKKVQFLRSVKLTFDTVTYFVGQKKERLHRPATRCKLSGRYNLTKIPLSHADIDECSTNSHSCDANAVCNNTVGLYVCACKAGYTGDGRTCTGKL